MELTEELLDALYEEAERVYSFDGDCDPDYWVERYVQNKLEKMGL